MNYHQLVQLYFERSTATQNFWNLYVVILGGVLAFSSLRKQPAPVTTLLVGLLFALFAVQNLGALRDATAQRFATLQAVRAFPATTADGNVRQLLEPTLTPATYESVRRTHLIADGLTLAALAAMELRRRRYAHS